MSKSPFVTTIDLAMAQEIKNDLIDQGFEISVKPYMIFSAQKKGIAIHAYESGKLVIQGAQMGEFMEFYLEPKLGLLAYTNPHADLDVRARIGADESGKGDFFGPLCVAAVFAKSEAIEELVKKGVKDSKALTDKKISQLADVVRATCEVETLALFPEKYNELYPKFGNLNSMLAWAHATCISKLIPRAETETIIIDKFAHDSVMLRAFAQKQIGTRPLLKCHAESDVVVAAASIIARDMFVKGLQRLGTQYATEFPKGGSQLATQAAKRLAFEYGADALRHSVKLHFKNARDIVAD